MTEKFFKVTLLSDVVLNNKLATEGNMETLDYIPGSNFLGIVAGQLYKGLGENESYDIFHSGKVSFGDATISKKGELSYPAPFDYMMIKGEEKLGENPVYLQHFLSDQNHPKDNHGFKKQLKQNRSGFITAAGAAITKIKKTFALKSAQDAATRRSKEGAMFGFESLKNGQEFIFSVRFKDENFIEKVSRALTGEKRIGKSKTAQYGIVHIQPIDAPKKVETSTYNNSDYSLVYVQSNLCIIDTHTGQPTLQPLAGDLGLTGNIDWSKSLVRSYSYSPWNGKRNTNDTLRICIAAGSVLYIDQSNESGEKSVGAFQSEGLGRIIANPHFLNGNENAECDFVKRMSKKPAETKQEMVVSKLSLKTSLGKFLKKEYQRRVAGLELSKDIQTEFENGKSHFQRVTSSQWGAIRAYATKAKSFSDLKNDLIEGDEAYLKHGVAHERIWSKGHNLRNLKEVFGKAETSSNPTIFIARFAAEMAKHEQAKEKNKR